MTNYVIQAFETKRLKKNPKSRLKNLLDIFLTTKKRVKLLSNNLETKNTAQRILAYPQTDRQELALIMKLLNLKYVQIVKSPWNQELIGIIKLSDIKEFV